MTEHVNVLAVHKPPCVVRVQRSDASGAEEKDTGQRTGEPWRRVGFRPLDVARSWSRPAESLLACLPTLQGPGAYNLVFDHRVEALMTEAEVYDLGRTNELGLEDVDATSVATGRTAFTTRTAHSLADMSVTSMASSLGLKFGDLPTSPLAPRFGFGTADRSSSQKVTSRAN